MIPEFNMPLVIRCCALDSDGHNTSQEFANALCQRGLRTTRSNSGTSPQPQTTGTAGKILFSENHGCRSGSCGSYAVAIELHTSKSQSLAMAAVAEIHELH